MRDQAIAELEKALFFFVLKGFAQTELTENLQSQRIGSVEFQIKFVHRYPDLLWARSLRK